MTSYELHSFWGERDNGLLVLIIDAHPWVITQKSLIHRSACSYVSIYIPLYIQYTVYVLFCTLQRTFIVCTYIHTFFFSHFYLFNYSDLFIHENNNMCICIVLIYMHNIFTRVLGGGVMKAKKDQWCRGRMRWQCEFRMRGFRKGIFFYKYRPHLFFFTCTCMKHPIQNT